MKIIFSYLVMFLLTCQVTKSQDPIEISEAVLDFGNSSMPGFSVTIPEADYETAVKNWVKLLETGTKSKVVRADEGLSVFGARIKSVSDNPVNVFSNITGQDNFLDLEVSFELEKDKYAGSSELSGAREYLMDFAKDQYINFVEGQIAVEEKKLRGLKSDLKSLERSKSRMEKSIRSNEQDIRSDDQRLADLKNELAVVSSGLSRYEAGGMGNSTTADSDQIDDLQKEGKKIRKEIKSLERKLGKTEVEVSQDQREIPNNVNQQEDARYLVEEQEAVVRQLIDKRDTIKNYR